MQFVAVAVETGETLFAHGQRGKTIHELAAGIIQACRQELGVERIVTLVVATEDNDQEMSDEIEKLIFDLAPELFHEDYVWIPAHE